MERKTISIEREKLDKILKSLSQIEDALTQLYLEIANLCIEEDEPTEEEKKILEEHKGEEEVPLDTVLKEIEESPS